MLERNEIYRGLIKKPSVLGLPLLEFVFFLSCSGLLFMWVQSFLIIVPIVVLYLALFVAAKWDQNFLTVIWVTSKNIKRCRNAKFWSGQSYEP